MSKSIKIKIMTLSILSVLATASVLAIIVLLNRNPLVHIVEKDFKELGRSETSKIAQMVYERCATSFEQRQELVNLSILVADDQLANAGNVTFDENQQIEWQAVNQFSNETIKVNLPAMLVGGSWLGQNTSAATETPIVDDVEDITGCTATVFQRMNERGDMLRVATNVIKEDGTRAISTYIPALMADGTANPVISSILNGQTYSGTAVVVGKDYLTTYKPIKDSTGKVVGILFVGVETIESSLREWIMQLLVGTTGYVFIIGGEGEDKGHYIISKGGTRDGENIWEAKDDDGNLFIQDMVNLALSTPEGETGHIEYMWKNEGEDKARMKVSATTYFGKTDWVIGAGTYYSDFEDTVIAVGKKMDAIVLWTVIFALLFVAAGSFISFWIANMISNPLTRLVSVAERAADGDLTVEVDKTSLQDEVGQMIRAFGMMMQSTHQAVSTVSRASTDIAATSEELSAGADETGRAVNEVANTTGQVAAGAQDVTSNIGNAQESLRQTAKAVEGIASDIESVAAYASEAANQGAKGRKAADEGSTMIQQAATSVQETAVTVKSLGEKTQQIAEFIGIITGIADQTNLLALNAAIEAARAGDAGRGFAVVAEEVRKLAEESNQAAGNITDLVKTISNEMQTALTAMDKSDHEVSEAAEIVQEAGKMLGQIVESVDALTDKVQGISAAAEEINANTGEIVATMDSVVSVAESNAAAAEQISSATQEQNASMEEVSASANNLASLAQELNELVNRFKV